MKLLLNKSYKLLTLLSSPTKIYEHLVVRQQECRTIVRHCTKFQETILFTQVYRHFYQHLFPIIKELLVKRPSSAIILLAPGSEYSLIIATPHLMSLPQVICTRRLPKAIPNLKIAFSPSADNKLGIPHNFRLQSSVVKCVLQHGLADKGQFSEWFEPKPLHDYDVIFMAGPVFREGSFKSYCEKYPDLLDTRTVLNAGLCRTDSLIRWGENHSREDRGHSREELTIIYAPTWQPSASLETVGDDILEKLLRFRGKVILRPHAQTLMGGESLYGLPRKRSGEDWFNLLESLERRHSKVKFSRDINADDDFFAADLMISDVSGAAYEFMLMDKPVVFIDTLEFFKMHGTEGIQHWGRFAGDIVSDLSQLLHTIDLNLKNPARKAPERAALREKLLYNPGHAAERTAEYIVDILDNPNAYLKRNRRKGSEFV